MEFKLPELGEGVQEGELISWLVKEGDTVEVDQALMEVMTDKATVEVPSPIAGTVTKLLAEEGDMIQVDSVIAHLDESGSTTAAAPAPEAPTSAPSTPAVSPSPAQSPTQSSVSSSGSSSGSIPASPAPQYVASDVPAAPIVRAMAQREGIDLTAVAASGPEVSGRKRVLEEDLLNFLNQRGSQVASPGSTFTAPAAHVASTAIASTPAPAAASTSKPAELPQRTAFNQNETVERSPLRGLRRAIANSMVKSKFTAPHYCYVDDFECSELVEFRKVAKESAAQYGVKFSYLPLIVKAVVAGLKAFPQVNASLEETEKGFELVTKKFYHVGIAVNSDNGLLVPVIKHADQKSLLEIAHEINVLSEKTRAGKATADELKGSTFTITSMGNVGGRFATPIINYPEVGIMGVYKIRKEPVVQNDQIVVGQTMTLSLSLDHRVIDGVVGAEFSNYVIDRLKNPAKLMLEMY